MGKTEDFWQKFLNDTGRNPDARPFECFHFELSERLANELLALVLSGKKRATASSLRSFEAQGAPPPRPGDLSVVTDWDGNPRCVIETTAVAVLPFRDVTFEICRREGEDDNLESWRRGHTRFFAEEGKALGYEFSDDMPVVFEDFRVVYQI
jgi:uncharacterized protein YhfF